MNLIKQFFLFIREMRYYRDITLSEGELESIRKIPNKKEFMMALDKIKNSLANKVLTSQLTPDYIRGAIYTIEFIKTLIK